MDFRNSSTACNYYPYYRSSIQKYVFRAGVSAYQLRWQGCVHTDTILGTDPVQGSQHFSVSDARAVTLYQALKHRLPGYLLPKLVREIPVIAEGMPVLLVTGYPSVNTAIDSIKLTVTGCLPG